MTDRTPSDADALHFGFKRNSIVKPVLPTEIEGGGTVGPALQSEEYDMNHPNRGTALIFNHTYFKSGYSTRRGAETDVVAMSKAFKKLGFNVVIHKDLTKADVSATLAKVASQDHSTSDCLVVVVMTHGDSKELSAYDKVYETSLLWESFTGNKCPSLVAKPKLFFIQACRGSKVDDGVKVLSAEALRVTRVDGVSRGVYYLPETADILVANATYDGHYAWRNADEGSWFIQELNREIMANGEKKEICDIFTSVNRRVAIGYSSFVPTRPEMHMKRQMPNFLSTLTRKLYFNPKNK